MRRSQDHPAHTEHVVAKNTAGGVDSTAPPPGEIGLRFHWHQQGSGPTSAQSVVYRPLVFFRSARWLLLKTMQLKARKLSDPHQTN